LNDAKNRTKVSPRFAGNKRQNEVEKEIKPFKETIQLDESLIHDSELDIPLIAVTGDQGKVGALAALGLHDDVDEAVKVYY